MHHSFKIGLLLTATVLFASACSKKQEPSPIPNSAPSATQVEPAPPAAPVQAQVAPTGFEGDWRGESGPDLPVSFTIQGNQVTSLSASYAGKNGSCSFNGSLSSEGPATIADKTFTAKGLNDQNGHLEFTATGALSSDTEASGTLVWKGKSDLCGDIDLQYKWTAKKAPAEAAATADNPL